MTESSDSGFDTDAPLAIDLCHGCKEKVHLEETCKMMDAGFCAVSGKSFIGQAC